MSAPPYMKLYVADYLGDTHHLSVIEHGAYMLLLMAMWRAGGTLPAADANLAKLARCTAEQWAEIRGVVLSFFRVSRGRLTHKRLAAEMAKYENTSGKRSEAGKRGGSKKAIKINDISLAIAKQNGSNCLHNQNHNQNIETPLPPEGGDPVEPLPEKPEDDEVQIAFERWNAMAKIHELPIARRLDDGRRRSIRKRLADGGLAAWDMALEAVSKSRLCRGENERAWKADLDFVCQPKSWRRLLEGFYGADAQPVAPSAANPPESLEVIWTRRIKAYRQNAYWNRLEWGPPPGKPDCTLPAEILMANGYAPSPKSSTSALTALR